MEARRRRRALCGPAVSRLRYRGGNCDPATGVGEIGPGGLAREADHRAVDVDADRPVRRGLARRGVDTGQQVGTGGSKVEDPHLVDLPLVQPLLDGLLGPQAELCIPQRAVGLRVTRVPLRREVAEHVQQVAAVAQRVDQAGVARAGVLGDVAVLGQVNEALRLPVVRPGLSVDEAEQPLASGAEEVVTAVVGGLVERRHVCRTLQDGGQRLACVGRDVDDRLSSVEPLHDQEVDPRFGEATGRGRARHMDPEGTIGRVGVVDHVERAVTRRNDRRAVDRLRAGDADERAVPLARDGARLELREREPIGSRLGDPSRAEIGSTLEVDDRLTEPVLVR